MRLEAPVPPKALAAIRAPFLAAGATPIDPPVMQPLGLLLDLAGEAMRARLFAVTAEGAEDACLRPDFTLPIVRQHLASGAASGRYFYEGKAFRVAPPGSDRAEEFLQIGVEAYEAGDAAPEDKDGADAVIAALAWASASAGGRDDLTLTFGDVGLFAAFVDSLDLAAPLAARLKRAFARPRLMKAELAGEIADADDRSPSRLAGLLATLPEGEATEVLQELWALAGVEPVGGRGPAEIVHRLAERTEGARAGRLNVAQADAVRAYLAVSDRPQAALAAVEKLAGSGKTLATALDGWRRRLSKLEALGVPARAMTLATAFGRDFGYYDGVLFEVRSAALGPDRAVAAGGRYDGLPARLGGQSKVGAVGCMVRPGRAVATGGQG